MKKKSADYAAHHEAGHAVVATIEGYMVTSVSIWEEEPESWAGATDYAPQSFTCSMCGSQTQSRHLSEELQQLDDSCCECLIEKRRFGKRLLSGDAATRSINHPDYDYRDCDDDRAQLGRVYPVANNARLIAFQQAESGAAGAVSQSGRLISSTAQLILQRLGCAKSASVSGAEILRIVQSG